MPEVTVNTKKYNVVGNVRQQFYNVTGTTGDTLTVGLRNVYYVGTEGTAISAYSVAAGSNGQSVITLTGTISALDVEVLGT